MWQFAKCCQNYDDNCNYREAGNRHNTMWSQSVLQRCKQLQTSQKLPGIKVKDETISSSWVPVKKDLKTEFFFFEMKNSDNVQVADRGSANWKVEPAFSHSTRHPDHRQIDTRRHSAQLTRQNASSKDPSWSRDGSPPSRMHLTIHGTLSRCLHILRLPVMSKNTRLCMLAEVVSIQHIHGEKSQKKSSLKLPVEAGSYE